MRRHTLTAAVLAAAMILSVLAPLGAAAMASGDSPLTIDVDQTDDVVVTIERNGTAADNATLEVTPSDENDSYAGNGTYTADENGTVALPTPEENVSVDLTASADNVTATKSVTLEAADDEDEAADSFGALVSQFVEENRNDTDGPFGIAVANFVVQNNPGNAPDHAGPPSDDERGPPAHAGPDGDANDDGEDDGDADDEDDDDRRGSPDRDDDDKRGPPAHAGPDSDADDGGEEVDEADEADDDDEDDDGADGDDEDEDGDDS
ncbi:hypothetical protein [Natronosalvus rutilus]|uniref:Uncharacterized protein n=1 Tax=Natronosalvus rutilus TaxID=2953753 RepID=A0A9E7SWG2_9EURY|nr:hypothetical protein [Natronosalvus rutilus]UTF54026.1 hypothetical protein NGM29_01695 [Natronosalvus rutilus]